VRQREVRRLLEGNNSREFQLIFKIILFEYIRSSGVVHCLHSKRIDRGSMGLHLQGLRQLAEGIMFEKLSKNDN
jgi:hypothetical protein